MTGGPFVAFTAGKGGVIGMLSGVAVPFPATVEESSGIGLFKLF